MPGGALLAKTEVVIQDYNSNSPVVFTNLALNESLLSVNNFSFQMRPPENNASLNAIIDFKKAVLGKDVELSFKDGSGNTNYQFKGVVLEVYSTLVDSQYYEFHLSGQGHFCKVNVIPECHSFYKKKFDAIIDTSFQNVDLKDKVQKNLQTDKELHYIVQYDQTLFAFMSSLAARFGEWMFYDGVNLKIGKKPESSPIELTAPNDVENLNIRAQAIRNPENYIGTDIFKSELLNASQKEEAPDNPFIKAAADSGSKILENPGKKYFARSAFKKEENEAQFKLMQQAAFASSVYVTGYTRNNQLGIGKIVKIKDSQDQAGKSYIITQIAHIASNHATYSNNFTAVPIEVDVPPYTNPQFFPKATAQHAIVTDNEDDAGLARIKVKFPWMEEGEKTPWISVIVPQAGKDRGFRFIPEKEDEVMVDFWDNNAETPFVNGALYTEKNKPGIAESGNHVKMIGSRSGRRFIINDDEGFMSMNDNFDGEVPMNIVSLRRKDTSKAIFLESKESNDQYSIIRLNNQEALNLGLVVGGDLLLEINMEKEGPKISIKSKGDIEIKADQKIDINASEINMQAGNIKIAADSNLDMKASVEAKLEGTQVKIEGTGTLEAKGASTKVEGSGILELKGGGVASLEAGIVKIN